MPSKAARFAKGTGVYACRCCERSTRQTGRGDNEHIQLCAECFDLAGEENSLSDTDEFYESPQHVLALIETVEAKGGKVNCWASLKAEAKAKLKQQYWIGQLKAAGYTVEYHMQPGTEPFYKWVHADGDSQDESSVSEEDSWNAAWQHMESKCPK